MTRTPARHRPAGVSVVQSPTIGAMSPPTTADLHGRSLPQPPTSAIVRLLPPDVDVAGTLRRGIWTGVVWSRLGRGDRAWDWWRWAGAALRARGGVGSDAERRALRAWIAAERGRVLRELGLHGHAEALEVPALLTLRARPGTDPVGEAMLLVSLAADAVGRGRSELASHRLAAAHELLVRVPNAPRVARQRLRASWVAVEVAFLRGVPPDASTLPRWDQDAQRPVLPADHVHGTDFHAAKGLLFAGVVARDPRILRAALELAPPVLRWAVALALDDVEVEANRRVVAPLVTARLAWAQLVPPPGFAAAVARTPTAQRLRTVGRMPQTG